MADMIALRPRVRTTAETTESSWAEAGRWPNRFSLYYSAANGTAPRTVRTRAPHASAPTCTQPVVHLPNILSRKFMHFMPDVHIFTHLIR